MSDEEMLARKLLEAATEIATLTKQRDRAMKVVEAAQLWAREYHDARIVPSETPSEVRLFNAVVGFNSLAALDAEAAAETEGT